MLGTNVGQKAAQRVNIGCNEDKIWVFKPNASQIQSKDIIKTKVRHLLDIFWYWTKPGQKLGDLHCTPAPKFLCFCAPPVAATFNNAGLTIIYGTRFGEIPFYTVAYCFCLFLRF